MLSQTETKKTEIEIDSIELDDLFLVDWSRVILGANEESFVAFLSRRLLIHIILTADHSQKKVIYSVQNLETILSNRQRRFEIDLRFHRGRKNSPSGTVVMVVLTDHDACPLKRKFSMTEILPQQQPNQIQPSSTHAIMEDLAIMGSLLSPKRSTTPPANLPSTTSYRSEQQEEADRCGQEQANKIDNNTPVLVETRTSSLQELDSSTCSPTTKRRSLKARGLTVLVDDSINTSIISNKSHPTTSTTSTPLVDTSFTTGGNGSNRHTPYSLITEDNKWRLQIYDNIISEIPIPTNKNNNNSNTTATHHNMSPIPSTNIHISLSGPILSQDPTNRNTDQSENNNSNININSNTHSTPFLFMGSEKIASSKEILQQYGITHIVNCSAFESPNYFPDNYFYRALHLRDCPSQDILGIFEEAVRFIEDARKNQGTDIYNHSSIIYHLSSFSITICNYKYSLSS